MPEQAALPGFDATPKLTHRLFFAIFPDAQAAARIEQLAQQVRQEQGLKGKPLQTKRFHVTLHHIGDYVELPNGVVPMAREAAEAVSAAPFEVAFDRVASFSSAPRNRPLVMRGGDGLVALTTFQQTLGMALTKSGLGRWVKPGYTPHVTLLYDDRSVPEQPVETISWTAGEFVLVHSLIGQTLHLPLERWSLRV
jgi:2'-5' RNA ligase